jgi:hypothetical protein
MDPLGAQRSLRGERKLQEPIQCLHFMMIPVPYYSLPSKEIFMKIPKLDRDHEYEINAHQGDYLCLWGSLFHDDRENLTLEDGNGNKILTVYAITHEQLSDLYGEIGSVLGKV